MVATSIYMLVFRILHIGAGVAWAGSVFLFVILIQPSAASVGPAAGPFMMELMGRRKIVSWLLSLAGRRSWPGSSCTGGPRVSSRRTATSSHLAMDPC